MSASLVLNLGFGCWKDVANRLWSIVWLRQISAHNTNKVAICWLQMSLLRCLLLFALVGVIWCAFGVVAVEGLVQGCLQALLSTHKILQV